MIRRQALKTLLLAPAALAEPARLLAGQTPRPAKPLEFVAHDGREVSLASLRGKVVVVMFFSTDCPHCQRAADILAPIYAEMQPQGLEILALALNPTASGNLPAFIAKHRVRFPAAIAKRAEFARFAELSLMARFYYPYLLLVDKKGFVRAERQGADRAYFAALGENLKNEISELLAEGNS
jgi:peroxiredoxin